MLTAFAATPNITLISDPKVLAIPIQENHDTWVDPKFPPKIIPTQAH